jgi:hypothetical protein
MSTVLLALTSLSGLIRSSLSSALRSRSSHVTYTSLEIQRWLVGSSKGFSLSKFILSYSYDTATQGDLLNILQHSSNCAASDERDHVYAFMGLIHEEYELGVNYKNDNGKEVVFTQAARLIIEQHSNLHTLAYVKLQEAARHDLLPSWVPDWSKNCNPPRAYLFGRFPAVNTTYMSNMNFQDDGRTLEVYGSYIATMEVHPSPGLNLCVGTEGYNIWLPPGCVKDDQLWMLCGAETLVILRPTSHYKFEFVMLVQVVDSTRLVGDVQLLPYVRIRLV